MSLNLQEKILQAASELFYSQGIRATGIDAAIKAANTTKMSLYKYFPSKDALVLAFLHKRDEDFRTWVAAQVNGKAAMPKAKLLAVFDVIGEWMAVPRVSRLRLYQCRGRISAGRQPGSSGVRRVLRPFPKLYCRSGRTGRHGSYRRKFKLYSRLILINY